MTNRESMSDISRLPAQLLRGDVVCFGFLTHCLLLMVDQLPPQNGGAPVLDSVEIVGDDAAIAANILTQWGVPTRLITSPTGDDHRGETVRENLRLSGVNVRQEVKRGWPTPFEVGILDSGGGRTYYQRRDPGALAELRPPGPAQLEGAGLLYVDWYDGPSVVSAMENAASQDVPVFLNLESEYDNEPWVSGLLKYASICQVSMDLPGASGKPSDIARSLINRGVEIAVVTLGSEGCVVAQGQQAYFVKPPSVEIVDCYGAGAACSAGVIYGLRAGWSLENVARFASAYAGLKCGVSGIAGLPISDIQETASSIEAQLLPL